MAEKIESEQDKRTLAQFFFEVGYGAAWADAFMANGQKAAFPLTDEAIERAWAIAPEAHEDAEEWARNQRAADEVPAMAQALREAEKLIAEAQEALCGRDDVCADADGNDALHIWREKNRTILARIDGEG
jgi:hypothetical protein